MIEEYEQIKIPPQDVLKNKLLNSEIIPADFLKEVFELDQSDAERSASEANVDLLRSSDVENVFSTSLESDKNEYYNLLSLSQFHKAQTYEKDHSSNSTGGFRRALESAKKSGSAYEDWVNYIEATIAYLDNDSEKLKALEVESIDNKSLIQNFIKGLSERGSPDYFLDYSKPRN